MSRCEVRKLHRDDAGRCQQLLHPGDEIVDVRNVREHVVAEQQVGPAVLGCDFDRGLPSEETDGRRDAFFDRRLRDVGCRLDAQHRNSAPHEVLQQVSVVAGDLHYLAAGTEPEPFHHQLGVAARVLDPARRV